MEVLMNFDRILFPVDFSEHSQKLNRQVEWLAQKFNSRVTLLHVFEIPSSWYGGADAPMPNGEDLVAFANEEKQRLQNYSIRIPESRLERVSLEGGAAWHISNWVKEHAVDLVVMGTHGFGALRRMLLGSVAMKVLHDVDCPVWTQAVKVDDAPNFQDVAKILCPIELTEEAKPLLLFAKHLADSFGAKVELLHVLPEQDIREYRYLDGDFQKRLRALAEEELARVQEAAGTNFELIMTKGHIAHDAAEAALNYQADLMLIGRGKARGVFGTLRSHAGELIRLAPCPVLSYSPDWLAREFHAAAVRETVSPLALALQS
jgi:nucleotide-binding universal stress UspA family protein